MAQTETAQQTIARLERENAALKAAAGSRGEGAAVRLHAGKAGGRGEGKWYLSVGTFRSSMATTVSEGGSTPTLAQVREAYDRLSDMLMRAVDALANWTPAAPVAAQAAPAAPAAPVATQAARDLRASLTALASNGRRG